ncbi:YlbE-like family protein [Alkalicoccobacillus gibsonii]|jgi:hypothetical protein|uniref:YlbE-like family protein n=1 Tax=Alkalicoccobacillus gibsonii TaxID=79881 RepID=A0ABU9VJF6_9BACI|nr:YlbE-like family protein [Alkalicoccobacillus gibsonii]MBM0065283.1 hypothetical protein [Alkalicoccobacillus gibsonii]
MRPEIIRMFNENQEFRLFVRQHPQWYRTLSRDPSAVQALEKEANRFYGRTFPQRVEKMQSNLGLAMMMMEMLKMGQDTVAQTQETFNS